MKKYILFFAFLTLGLNFSFATQVEDLLGQYTCDTQDLNATFRLFDDNGTLKFEYCRELGQVECYEQVVFGEVVKEHIMGIRNGEVVPLENISIRVDDSSGEVVIYVETTDGIGHTFRK